MMVGRLINVVTVGDCAWAGQTLRRYAPQDIKYQHLERTKGICSKTIGITLRIMRSKGDIYHVHYGLQDHLITKLLRRKLTLCQFHRSDIRYTLKNPCYSWIVKTNLRIADRVIVAVPDVLSIARSYRADAEFMPNPVDLNIFRPAPLRDTTDKLIVLLASPLGFVKGVQYFVREYSDCQKTNPNSILWVISYGENQTELIALLKKLGTRFRLFSPVPHHMMPSLYHNSDVVVSDLGLGYLQMTSLEAMACHRPVIQYVDEKLYKKMNLALPRLRGLLA